jgi:glycerate kinase
MGKWMKIVVAPDSFKGSLSAIDAARAMREGVLRACPDAEIDTCPLSDGGEGFVGVLEALGGGSLRVTRVTGPLGWPVDAEWLLAGEGTAFIESAAVVGLALVPLEHRAPTRTTTFGVGELIRAAVSAGARAIVLGLGGTATTDGGVGMASALGVPFDGAPESVRGGDLLGIRGVDAGRCCDLSRVDLRALTDVDSPLTGRDGAAHVFAPQKGASLAEVTALEAGLVHLTTLTGDPGTHPGDGAAGGLGYGLRVFAGARLSSGIDFVLTACRFDERLVGCDLVLTGEGRLDGSSARGKVLAGVSRRCLVLGVPAIAVVGSVGAGAERLLDAGLTAYHSVRDRAHDDADSLERAAALVADVTEEAVTSGLRLPRRASRGTS